MANKIVIRISGGVLCDIYATDGVIPVEVQLVDYDDLEDKGLCSSERDEVHEEAIKGMECIY